MKEEGGEARGRNPGVERRAVSRYPRRMTHDKTPTAPGSDLADAQVLDTFRRWGYLDARLDPLEFMPPLSHPELAGVGRCRRSRS